MKTQGTLNRGFQPLFYSALLLKWCAFRSLWMCSFFCLVSTSFLCALPNVEVYFSPDEQVAERLIELIDQEQVSIRSAVYCLMYAEIAKALQRASQRGVAVEVIVDPFSVKTRSPLQGMERKGVSIYVWDPEMLPRSDRATYRPPLMHDKFCVFGDHTVWTGSYNFTRQASLANRENVVILHDSAIARRYLIEYQKIKKEGCRPYQQFIALKPKRKTLALK